MIVLDTTALLYWTLDPPKLTDEAQQAIENAEKILISSISIWEIALKAQLGKLEIPLPIEDFVERLQQIENLEILAVDIQAWLGNLALDWPHRDPADRTIVALASRNQCPLVTSDSRIANFYQNAVW